MCCCLLIFHVNVVDDVYLSLVDNWLYLDFLLLHFIYVVRRHSNGLGFFKTMCISGMLLTYEITQAD